MISIKKIALKDLVDFVTSDLYVSFTDKPISLLRAQSYSQNPNGTSTDIVLYMAFDAKKLVGYRTLLSDIFIDSAQKIQFAWLSGNWVSPEYRRQNISTLLFNEAIIDWKGKLMYTNYAEASKAVYDKTNHFKVLKTLTGFRYYQRMCLAELLAPKSKFFNTIKPILGSIDKISNLLLDTRFSLKNKKNLPKNCFKINNFDTGIVHFLKPFKTNELFQRDEKIHQWIQNYPWIKTDKDTQLTSKYYYFSLYASTFENSFYKLIDPKTKAICAILNIHIKDGCLKIPYLYSTEKAYNLVANFVLTICNQQKINYVTVYDVLLNKHLQNSKNKFLTRKMFEQTYFVSASLLESFPNLKQATIQTGDGDGVFS